MFDVTYTTSREPSTGLLHITDAAAQLRISAYDTKALVEAGELPATEIAGRTYIPGEAIDEYLRDLVTKHALSRIAAKAMAR